MTIWENLEMRGALWMSLVVWCVWGGDAYAERLICDVEKFVICSSKGCEGVDPEQRYTLIDTEQRLYNLCSWRRSKCDYFELSEVIRSGVYVFFKTGSASYLKMAVEGVELFEIKQGQFSEVRDAGPPTFLSWGTCKRVN